jgi:hypothetical protein
MPLRNLAIALKRKGTVAVADEARIHPLYGNKGVCGAARPSKELKRKERNSHCPLIAPKKSAVKLAQTLFFEKCLLQHIKREFLPLRVIRTAQFRSPDEQFGNSFRVADLQEVGLVSQHKRVLLIRPANR